MTTSDAIGFWSYAHDDDRSARGGILKLAESIAEEYDLLTGRTLELFVDRTALQWGDNWKERIDTGLSAATFFIPIITPRYFSRPECRREFIEFSAQATSLGLQEFILPVLYVPVAGLDVDSTDELVASVARTQYEDWSSLRLLGPDSSEYRLSVNRLVTRLTDIETRLAEVQRDNERPAAPEDEEDDLLGLIAKVEALLPDWHDAVVGARTTVAQRLATADTYYDNDIRLRARRAKQSAHIANLIRFANDSLPLSLRHTSEAARYSARSIELDPVMTKLLRDASEHPAGVELIESIGHAIDDAVVNIEAGKELRPDRIDVVDFYAKHVKLSRTFRELVGLEQEYKRLVGDGNQIVMRWAARLAEVREAAKQGSQVP
ncbi:TIR domain-containing protein [Saccharothrix saharensis]|uniref:TIR domain-containing protein n=1 Tax=Saccharothrix saharensis TaxID=571190 RepID=A0A543JFX1_9PSEU|nr:toll/interleukin-1 receptor domain-containing protein [Saccharothrix saharensis]TQM81729.1 TIR domain-containing protein [Saccharothrix saharensis]